MITLERWLAGVLAKLCALFEVSPNGLRQGRRGNQPPPEGGISSY